MLSLVRGLVLALCCVVPGAAQEIETTLMAGPAGGTYARIGRDLAAIGAECGLGLNVQESAGSVENMQAVRDRRATQLGLVQSDALEYFRTFEADDPALRRTARGVRVALPLYDEEVHVLARRDIAGLGDLAGKRVAVGDAGSGTRVTADLILDLAQVEPAERRAIAPAAALDALLGGEIDALFYVVGAPAEIFASGRIDPESFHLLPLDEPVLTAVYSPAEIPAGSYPFVTEPVKVVAVRAVLVTFDFDPRRNSYQAASCRAVADWSHLIVTRLDRLRQEGHPKWGAVDLRALPAGWQVSNCVLEGLDPAYDFTCRHPDGTEVREGLAAAADSEANALYLQRVCARIGC